MSQARRVGVFLICLAATPALAGKPKPKPASASKTAPQPAAKKEVAAAFDVELGGISSRYTAPLLSVLKSWPPPIDYASKDPVPVKIVALSVPDEEFYIGAQQWMWVEAPMATVDKVLRDVNHYAEIFPGYEDIHVESAQGNRMITYWEQRIPLPFVSNVKYRMLYLIDDAKKDRVVYRYQLKDSSTLYHSDGAIVIEAVGARTRYTEYDFFDADYGIAKTLAPSRIWRDGLEGMFLSDLGIKLRAEHPEWESKQVRKEADKILDQYPVDDLLKNKQTFYKLPH